MNEQIAYIEFFKELYEIERNRKFQIDNFVQFPTTILTLLIGGVFFIFTNDKIKVLEFDSIYEKGFLVASVVIFVITITITIAFLLVMFHNVKDKYKYLPSPNEFKNRQILLNNHFLESNPNITSKKKRKKKAIEYAKEQFRVELLDYYIVCASNNQSVNDKRLKAYYFSRKFLMYSVISLILIIGIIIINKI